MPIVWSCVAASTQSAKVPHVRGSVLEAGKSPPASSGTFVHRPSRCTPRQLTHRRSAIIAAGMSSISNAVFGSLLPMERLLSVISAALHGRP